MSHVLLQSPLHPPQTAMSCNPVKQSTAAAPNNVRWLGCTPARVEGCPRAWHAFLLTARGLKFSGMWKGEKQYAAISH